MQRRGRDIWACQAVAPTDPVGITTFVFSSGISIAPAVGRQRVNEAAGTAVQSCWGAPTIPHGPDAPIGAVAQEVQAAFIAENLDPARYALFCSDTWYEVD